MSQQTRNMVTQLVVFKLGEELYAVDVQVIREVTPPRKVTQVPLTREYVDGVMNLRGRVITVMDLRRRFGLPATAHTEETRVAVAELNGEQVGLVVDEVHEVVRIQTEDIEDAADVVTTVAKQFVMGLAQINNQVITILDMERVLPMEEHKVV